MINVFCYQDIDFQGSHKQIYKESNGFQWQNKMGSWNDQISSVKVLEGYIAFFQHEDFNGSMYFLPPGTVLPNLFGGNWNDQISSFIASSQKFDPVAAATNLRNSNYTDPNPC